MVTTVGEPFKYVRSVERGAVLAALEVRVNFSKGKADSPVNFLSRFVSPLWRGFVSRGTTFSTFA